MQFSTLCVLGEGLEFSTASGFCPAAESPPTRKLAFAFASAYAFVDRDTGGPVTSYQRTVAVPIRDLSRAIEEREILIEQRFDFSYLRRLLAAAVGDQPGVFVCTGDDMSPDDFVALRQRGANVRYFAGRHASVACEPDDLGGPNVHDHQQFRLSWFPCGSGIEEELHVRYAAFETQPELLLPAEPTGVPGSVELLTLDPESLTLCVFADGDCRARLVEALLQDADHPAFFVRVTEMGVWKWMLNAGPEWNLEGVDVDAFR